MPTRRAYRIGSVEPNGNGFRWSAYIAGKRHKSRNYPTREEAEQVLAQVLVLVASGVTKTEPKPEATLTQWGQVWFSRRTTRAVEDDARRWNVHIANGSLGRLQLKDLTRKGIKEWLRVLQTTRKQVQQLGGKRRAKGDFLSHQTVRHCLNLLRRALGDAVEDELIPANPAAGIRLQAQPEIYEPWTFLSLDEIEAVLRTAPEPARTAYAVAIYAGPRKGELFGLHWADVHEADEAPRITLRFSHGGPTKGNRIRHVPLFEPAVQALAALRAEVCPRPTDLVFPAPRGGRRRKSDAFGWPDRKRGKQDLDRKTGVPKGPTPGHKTLAGITRDVRFHDLRHTFASHLAMGSWGHAWSLQEIGNLLGHRSTKMTERYAHLSLEHLHAKAKLMNFGPKPSTSNGPSAPAAPPEATSVSTARPAGLEPATHGLEGLVYHRNVSGDRRHLGLFEGCLATAAATLLTKAAAGQVIPVELLEMLGVDPDDPLVVRRAIGRAREVLTEAAKATASSA